MRMVDRLAQSIIHTGETRRVSPWFYLPIGRYRLLPSWGVIGTGTGVLSIREEVAGTDIVTQSVTTFPQAQAEIELNAASAGQYAFFLDVGTSNSVAAEFRGAQIRQAPLQQWVNNVSTTLAANISDVATSLTITSATGFPTLGANEFFDVTLEAGTTREIVRVQGRTGTTLSSLLRGREGTTAVAWSAGSIVSIRLTAGQIAALRDLT